MKENEIVFTKDNIDGLQFIVPPDETNFTIKIAGTGKAIVSWPCDGEVKWAAYEIGEVTRHLNMKDWTPIDKTQTPQP